MKNCAVAGGISTYSFIFLHSLSFVSLLVLETQWSYNMYYRGNLCKRTIVTHLSVFTDTLVAMTGSSIWMSHEFFLSFSSVSFRLQIEGCHSVCWGTHSTLGHEIMNHQVPMMKPLVSLLMEPKAHSYGAIWLFHPVLSTHIVQLESPVCDLLAMFSSD